MAEFELIDIIRQHCQAKRSDVQVGIGDDGAIVRVPEDNDLVICTDTLVAGVHFLHGTDAADIGWKSLAVNLSDLAAMGATPAWATLALTLPDADVAFVRRFAQGFAELANRHGLDLIGGDTTRGPLSVSVTAHGLLPAREALPAGKAMRRSGAVVGDIVCVSGTLGDAAGGLRILQSAGLPFADNGPRQTLVDRLNRPQPRVNAGVALLGLASACIDVSDGLVADLGHVAACSKVGIEVSEDSLPVSAALAECFDEGIRRELQLRGGDDYELAFTISESNFESMQAAMAALGCRVSRIGRVVAGSGVHVIDGAGRRRDLADKGWEHFK